MIPKEFWGYFVAAGKGKVDISSEIWGNFTKSDLKEGMILELRDGTRMMWLFGMARGITETLFSLNNDLTCEVDEYTIMKVYERGDYTSFRGMLDNPGKLIWERRELRFVTKNEVIQILEKHYGCKVEIME